MSFNLDTLLSSQTATELTDAIRQRLELASYRLDSITILALQVEDLGPGLPLSTEQKRRLLATAKEGIEGATRREAKKERRVADRYFLIDSILFVILFNAYQRNYLIPVRRILHSLGTEARVINCLAGDGYTRRVAIGSAFWLPRYGEVSAQGMFGRAVEALGMAQTMAADALYERLQIPPMPHLTVRYFEYPWDEVAKGKPLLKGADLDALDPANMKVDAFSRKPAP